MTLNNLATAGRYFLVITGELVLLFVVISFIVGLIQEFVPEEKMKKVLGRPKSVWGNILGAFFGALTPFCSCSTIPILVGLLEGGAPFGACTSFLIASPVLNPIILGLLITLFGWRVTLGYAVVVFALAVISGLVWEQLGLSQDVKDLSLVKAEGCCCTESCCESPRASARRINLSLLQEEPDTYWDRMRPKLQGAGLKSRALFLQVLPYLFVGAGIGAFIYGFIPANWVANVAGPGNPFAVPIAALVGVPMYIRAETIIPIGLTLVHKGMGIGTVTALIIGGAGASIPEVTLLASIFRIRTVLAFVLTVFLIATGTGYLFNALF